MENSTDLMHRVGKKLFLSHFDVPPGVARSLHRVREDDVGRRELFMSLLSYSAVLKALCYIPKWNDTASCAV